jgi:hypothetical protein
MEALPFTRVEKLARLAPSPRIGFVPRLADGVREDVSLRRELATETLADIEGEVFEDLLRHGRTSMSLRLSVPRFSSSRSSDLNRSHEAGVQGGGFSKRWQRCTVSRIAWR